MANQTKIEWVRNEDGSPGHTINPVKGLCPVACSYCYARAMYHRFKWDPEIRYEDPFWQFHALKKKQPSRVFIGSTMELFGPWIRPEWMHSIISFCKAYPQHTFIFLTKLPEKLPKEWPDNCWVGVTATDHREFLGATNYLYGHRIAKTQFISIEPLLWWDTSWWFHPLPSHISKKDIDWLIIGQQTPVRKSTTPKRSWIDEIEEACKKADIPYFEKENLKTLLNRPLVQEFPKVKSHAQ